VLGHGLRIVLRQHLEILTDHRVKILDVDIAGQVRFGQSLVQSFLTETGALRRGATLAVPLSTRTLRVTAIIRAAALAAVAAAVTAFGSAATLATAGALGTGATVTTVIAGVPVTFPTSSLIIAPALTATIIPAAAFTAFTVGSATVGVTVAIS